jgi:hypothetical protein
MTYTDARGSQITTGDIARAVGIPNQLEARTDSLSINALKQMVNNYGRIAAVSTEGLVEFQFRIRFGLNKGLHSVWLEPYLLQKKKVVSISRRAANR